MHTQFLTHIDQHIQHIFADLKMRGPLETLQHRETSYNDFLKLGLPKRTDKTWQYMSLKQLFQEGMCCISKPDEVKLPMHAKELPHHVEIYNGQLAGTKNIPQGVSVGTILGLSLPTATLEHTYSSSIGALVEAASPDEVVIYIAPNAQIETPLSLGLIADATGSLFLPHRVRLIVGEGASLTLDEEYISTKHGSVTSAFLLDIELGARAHLEYISSLDERYEQMYIRSVRVHADTMSSMHYVSYLGNSSLVNQSFQIYLAGEKAQADIGVVSMPSLAGVHSSILSVKHVADETVSNQLVKIVANDKATGQFYGTIEIPSNKHKIEAHQQVRGLFTSDEARINCVPELRIYSDDVVCSHGLSVGHVDEESLAFAQSRGLSEQHARQMLLYGFLSEPLQKIKNNVVRKRLVHTLEKQMKLY